MLRGSRCRGSVGSGFAVRQGQGSRLAEAGLIDSQIGRQGSYVFSPALEIVLTVAYREATSRRHTHLTLEHLLYALAHDPDGERILA
ncbi:MAG: Clp protease N-terminal domain-containing protein, partial [Vicinamibacterales bacterium]